MWFRPVNEISELVSGMPERIFVIAKIRIGSRFKRFHKMFSGIPQRFLLVLLGV
jgi:hypothetical protein